MDRHIGKSRKCISGDKHAYCSVPTALKKRMKTTLKMNIYTIFKQTMTISTFINISTFMALKRTKVLTI